MIAHNITDAPSSLPQPMKVAVLVSGNGSNLQVLIDAVNAGKLPIEIVGVMSNKEDAYALSRAKEAGIETCVLSHVQNGQPFEFNESSSLKDDTKKKMGIKTFERHALIQLNEWQPDLIVLAGFMRVLSSEFIANAPAPMINLHPSLLPKFKGLDTHQRAIEAGEAYHGCSVHVVTAELDAGQVLTQAVMPLAPSESQNDPSNPDSQTLESMQQAVHRLEHQLLPWTILLIVKEVLNLNNLTDPNSHLIHLPIRLWFD